MTKTRDRAAIAAGLGLLVSALLVACTPSPEQLSEDRMRVLENYLDSENAALEELVSQTTTYVEAEATGYFEGNSGGEHFPATVVTFTYTYTERVVFRDPLDPAKYPGAPSWESGTQTYPLAELESRKIALISSCSSQVVPAIHAAGLEGPLRIDFVYLNRQFANDESWRASCSSDGP